MRSLSILAAAFIIASCSSSKPDSGLDYSDIQSTSLDAMHPSPTVVMTNKSPRHTGNPNDYSNAPKFTSRLLENDTVSTAKPDYSNIKSLNMDAQIYNTSPDNIMEKSVIVQPVIQPK